jgi:hypothetical protein
MKSSPSSVSRKSWIKGLALLVILAAGLWLGLRGYLGVRHYTESPEDLRELRSIISQCKPLLEALDQYRSEKGAHPLDLNDMKLPYPYYLEDMTQAGAKHSVYYHSDSGTHFNLYVKLGWDAALRYDSLVNEWAFDPGDGSEGFMISL